MKDEGEALDKGNLISHSYTFMGQELYILKNKKAQMEFKVHSLVNAFVEDLAAVRLDESTTLYPFKLIFSAHKELTCYVAC